MKKTLRDRIDELAAMDVKALQAEHEKLFGQPSVSTHRQYLFRKIAWQVQAEAQGGFVKTLVEQVTYDGRTGKVTVGFRTAGIRQLCVEVRSNVQ